MPGNAPTLRDGQGASANGAESNWSLRRTGLGHTGHGADADDCSKVQDPGREGDRRPRAITCWRVVVQPGGSPLDSMSWLFSFEGLDGVGKSTQVDLTRDWLEGQGYRVRVIREPGGTDLGEKIRDLLLYQSQHRDARAEFLLFAAARAELVRTVVVPFLAVEGAVVLADRYVDSSEAYQGAGLGVDLGLIHTVNRSVCQSVWPQGTLWLDGVRRTDGSAHDVIEARPRDFFDRVRLGYQTLADREPKRVVRINGDQDPEQVFAEVVRSLRAWLHC